MAASEVAIQEIAQPELVAVAPAGKKTETNRLQRRFDRLTRRNHELAEAAESWQKRYNEAVSHGNKLAAENTQLEADLERAISLVERYQKMRPIVPDLDRYERKK